MVKEIDYFRARLWKDKSKWFQSTLLYNIKVNLAFKKLPLLSFSDISAHLDECYNKDNLAISLLKFLSKLLIKYDLENFSLIR